MLCIANMVKIGHKEPLTNQRLISLVLTQLTKGLRQQELEPATIGFGLIDVF